MIYNAIIIDDEPLQILDLRNMLSKDFWNYTIIAECNTLAKGLEAIKSLNPDLIFLDVELNPDTGFDLLKKLKPVNFEVIFTTSFAQYAIEAIKCSALDYLMKPVGKEELAEALKKFEEKKRGEPNHKVHNLLANMELQNKGEQKIGLATSKGLDFYKIGNIIKCESANVTTTFFMQDKEQIVVSKSIQVCEEMLENYGFVRVHKEHLINLSHVKQYIKGEGGQVLMDDGTYIDVSRRKKDEFLKKLNRI